MYPACSHTLLFWPALLVDVFRFFGGDGASPAEAESPGGRRAHLAQNLGVLRTLEMRAEFDDDAFGGSVGKHPGQIPNRDIMPTKSKLLGKLATTSAIE